MFLTETDLINMKLTAEGALNTSEIIKSLIDDDVGSLQKKNMAKGEKYFVCEHDVLQKNFKETVMLDTEINSSGKDEERLKRFVNENRSNHHNVDAFHRVLVEQKVSYLVGKEPTITVTGADTNADLKKYQELLSDFANEEFNEVVQDWVTGASNKGFECLHVYYDDDGKLNYCVVPASEVIPVYDEKFGQTLEQLIRYYDIVVVKGKQKLIRKKVEWWTREDVTYYVENDNRQFVLDTSCPINPAPHWWDTGFLNGALKRKEPHSWGRVPFIVLKNNSQMTTDLQPIKGLIDAYDLISSEGTNNFLDLVELYWVIQGYGGDMNANFVKKLQINRVAGVTSTDGSIEAKQVELPVTGRIDFLKMLRKDIFHFGQGIDVDADKFGNAPSGVSLKFQYNPLDLKATAMVAKLKKAIKTLLWFFTDDYNRTNNTSYDVDLVEVKINKNIISNEVETVEMIRNSSGIVSDKTLLAKHPFVDDVNAELEEIEAQKKREQEEFEKQNHSHTIVGGGADEE